jgi:hypothetical protein
MAMSNFQWLLHRIPEPSLRLFLILTVFGALVVTSFAMLDGSGHDNVPPHAIPPHVKADQVQADRD